MQDEMFDVAIAGAGPVGLWLACELRLAGIAVVVLERRSRRINQSRALTIHGRTLEVFALRGLAERFMARGRPLPTGHFGLLDTRLDFSGFETRFPHNLFIPQATTEILLEERALELGVVLRRGHTLTHLDHAADGVVFQGETTGGSFRVGARYGIGADGARSLVRSRAEIDFPGSPATQTFAMGDVRLDPPDGPPMLSRMNENGHVLIAPLGDGVHHRIVLLDRERRALPQTEPLTLDELAASARKILGTDCNARAPLWLTRFTDETRLATHYRKGRLFLVGDAAHIHTPAGGQGMNVGIQDAMNLGWKLAAVLKGQAPEPLLDTFERERRPIGRSLYENTLAQTALISSFDPSGLALRAQFSRYLQITELNKAVAGEMSGFAVGYPGGLLPEGEETGSRVGQRVPDEDLILADGTKSALFGNLAQGRWLNLSLCDGRRVPLPSWLAQEAVADVTARRGNRGGELAGRAAVLVRPDGYVAGSISCGGDVAAPGMRAQPILLPAPSL